MLNAGVPLDPAVEPVRMIEPPLRISGSAFCPVKITPFTFRPNVLSTCSSVISPSGSVPPPPAFGFGRPGDPFPSGNDPFRGTR